jgi:hypothetical protein
MNATPPEVWTAVPGLEGRYDVSNHGRVRSWLPWRGQSLPRVLAGWTDSYGYRKVGLYHGGAVATEKVHSLVALAFLGRRPEGLHIRHLDGDQLNNAVWNLAYGTAAENAQDRIRHGTSGKNRKTHCPQGHLYDDENSVINSRGFRECRTCRRAAGRAYWRRSAKPTRFRIT